jgi:hypothetical protein
MESVKKSAEQKEKEAKIIKKKFDLINSKVYPDNQFQFYPEERNYVGVYVDLLKYKQSEIIYTVYFSHLYSNLLLDCCKALKMPFLFSFIPNKSTIDNVIFLGEKTTKVNSKNSVIKKSAYLQYLVRTFAENHYDIFCPRSVHALFEFDDINVISTVRDVLVSFLVKSSIDGVSEDLKVFEKNTKKVLNLRQAKQLQIKPEDVMELSAKDALEAPKSKINQEVSESLLTRVEAAKELKISLPTLSSWTKQGKITSYGKGSRVYYKKNELIGSLEKLK